ncbi:MAG: hypothetical protein ABL900_14995 [Burkholderiaceae bacterium]
MEFLLQGQVEKLENICASPTGATFVCADVGGEPLRTRRTFHLDSQLLGELDVLVMSVHGVAHEDVERLEEESRHKLVIRANLSLSVCKVVDRLDDIAIQYFVSTAAAGLADVNRALDLLLARAILTLDAACGYFETWACEAVKDRCCS